MRHSFYAAALLCVLIGRSAQAGETTTYTYDVLGRLQSSSITCTVNNGQAVTFGLDAAHNRSSYAVTGAGTPLTGTYTASSNGGSYTGLYGYRPA